MSSDMLMTDILQVQESIIFFHQIFYVCRLIAVICSGGVVILFMVFEIPKILGELTGITAKRKIREYKKRNASIVHCARKKFHEMVVLKQERSNKTMLLDEEFETQLLEETKLLEESTLLDETAITVSFKTLHLL
ncbi:hypothetical protein IMSAGC011_00166 [Lachnospiraceae bacterium]|nr:hypothetical protein IMSAGC011_00166 [Lachnospiraceae bacterium]